MAGAVRNVNNSAKKTLEFLGRTTNESAVPVLLAGLQSSAAEIQDEALIRLLRRRNGSGQGALIRRWDELTERWKWTIAQHPRQVVPAVRNAILSSDETLCANGCDALLRIREYELIATLVTAAREASDPQASLTADTLVQLAERMHEELNQPPESRQRRDLVGIRRQVVLKLEYAVEAYEQHRRRQIVEAFLLLCPTDNRVLTMILAQPRHAAYLIVLELLRGSARLGIMRLIFRFVTAGRAPSVVLQVIGHRTDPPFVRQLLQRVGGHLTREVRDNLRRIESIAWMRGDLSWMSELTDTEQEAAVQLALASGVARPTVFRLVCHILDNGEAGSRRRAAEALADFGGAEANELAVRLLNDSDPVVQANVLVQLRKRSIPGAMGHLIRALSSPHECVRDAARSCLTEFRFDRYVNAFDMMDEAARRSTGRLVKQVDSSVLPRLAAELQSRMRTRRMRALELTKVMDLVDQLESLVICMTRDEDHFVRAAAARTLAQSQTATAAEALQECLADRSITVRETAKDSLKQLRERRGDAPLSATTPLPTRSTTANATTDPVG